jgi:hypothetical protein
VSEEERYAEESFRERRIWRNVVVGALVVTVIICALGWRLVAPRLEAAKQLDRAATLVKQADPLLADLDSAVQAAVASPTTETAAVLAAQTPHVVVARAKLTEALGALGPGHAHLADEEHRQSDIVRSGIEGRLAMANAATAIISAAQKAAAEPSPRTTIALQELVSGISSTYQSGKQKAAGADAALSGL